MRTGNGIRKETVILRVFLHPDLVVIKKAYFLPKQSLITPLSVVPAVASQDAPVPHAGCQRSLGTGSGSTQGHRASRGAGESGTAGLHAHRPVPWDAATHHGISSCGPQGAGKAGLENCTGACGGAEWPWGVWA